MKSEKLYKYIEIVPGSSYTFVYVQCTNPVTCGKQCSSPVAVFAGVGVVVVVEELVLSSIL